MEEYKSRQTLSNENENENGRIASLKEWIHQQFNKFIYEFQEEDEEEEE
eukprot:CAMPEP_0172513500 /NCGR_PEP_ID=MMETSP1066-20121228/252937_1 /TAXON_ID=671091 /ORGANISM="Coscinodiscus wailesii, Strain CCMP2513" /LENGTH=48 /DNA_ID= /DNA_START= /DNA_END= /DNA_ORIENTATION=